MNNIRQPDEIILEDDENYYEIDEPSNIDQVSYIIKNNGTADNVPTESQLKKNTGIALTNKPVGLPPCGEICSFKGRVVKRRGTGYPRLEKNFNCDNIMKRMAFRNHTIEYPPPQYPPKELIDAFTMNGDMPIEKIDYRNSPAGPARTMKFTKDYIDDKIGSVQRGDPVNTYNDGNCVQDILKKYVNDIKGRHAVVIGTLRPWLEAVLLAYGVNRVTTLEYTNIKCELDSMEAYFPYTYAEKYLQGYSSEFDFAASFSSIEHSGLGRYTDPLNPYGDFEATAQVWCMVKPGGLFAIGVPGNRVGSNDDSSSLVWNAHRVYGSNRLQHLTANWDVVEQAQCNNNHHFIILKKPLN